MSNSSVRRGRVEDAAEIARLAAELGYPTALDEMKYRLAMLLENPLHYIGVAEGSAGHLLGWVHAEHRLSVEGGERAELMGLVVDPTGRRTGLGASLVRSAEAWALQRGLRKMMVRSNVARDASHSFYEAMGYSCTKTQHAYAKSLSLP